jgi:hypothetical protein
MAAAAVVHEKALNENFIGKSLSGWVALSESRAKRVALRPARGQGASTRSRDERQIGGQDAIDLAQLSNPQVTVAIEAQAGSDIAERQG